MNTGQLLTHAVQGKAVMNLSISGKRDSKQLRGDMWAARKSVNTGIFVSAAAGNNNRPAGEYAPGAEPAVCTVGAVDREGNESTFSNYGSVVDILAPGQDIEAAQLGGGMVKMKGTSMAAPHVAGVAATWLSAGFAAVDGLCAELTRAGEPATKSKAGTTNRMVQNKAWAAWEGSY